jgi:hypothetical protein
MLQGPVYEQVKQKMNITSYYGFINKITPLIELFRGINLTTQNFVVAGGYVFNSIANYTCDAMNNSDIDLFFFGDLAEQQKTILGLMEHLGKTHKLSIYRVGESNVLEIHIPNFKKIQMIPTSCNDPINIIKSFDMECLKVYILNLLTIPKVLCTYCCLNSYFTWTTYVIHTDKTKTLNRYVKMLAKGMRLISQDFDNFDFYTPHPPTKLTEITDMSEYSIKLKMDYMD